MFMSCNDEMYSYCTQKTSLCRLKILDYDDEIILKQRNVYFIH